MSQANFANQQKTVVVESVIKLSQEQLDQVAKALELDSKAVKIVNQKNPALIAGLRVSYQGKVLDMSLQNKLNLIKEMSDE